MCPDSRPQSMKGDRRLCGDTGTDAAAFRPSDVRAGLRCTAALSSRQESEGRILQRQRGASLVLSFIPSPDSISSETAVDAGWHWCEYTARARGEGGLADCHAPCWAKDPVRSSYCIVRFSAGEIESLLFTAESAKSRLRACSPPDRLRLGGRMPSLGGCRVQA